VGKKRGILHGKALSIFLMVLSTQINHTHQDPTVIIIIISNLSNDRSKASSKMIPPHSEM